MQTEGAERLFFKVKRPIPEMGAAHGDLFIVDPRAKRGSHFTLCREANDTLHYKVLDERRTMLMAGNLDFSGDVWARIFSVLEAANLPPAEDPLQYLRAG
ncbi:MAG: hypothetical protein M3409_05985 [Gemmatimonadota bacterium]|nr:hypothetical protein [Gemmatimonadota bacterium]